MPAKKTTSKKKTATKKPAAVKETKTETQTTIAKAEETVARETETVTAQTKTETQNTVTVLMNYYEDVIFNITDNKGIERSVRIKGINTQAKETSQPGQNIILPVGKYGITRNVDKELWEEVKKKYRQMPMFENKIIFELGSKEDAEKIAEEYRQIRNGYEPIDTETLAEKAEQ